MLPRILFRNGRSLLRDQTRIMAILNITPDSFSGDGTLNAAVHVERAQQALSNGATILDLGAESTRPGAARIPAEEELDRILPVLKAVRSAFPNVILSVDTTKAVVFEEAYASGADLLNTVGGLSESLCSVISAVGCSVVITHPGGNQRGTVPAICSDLLADARRAREAGIPVEKILLDPGIGFGKTPEENIGLLAALPEMVKLGYATLVGASRKSTLGLLTGQPVHQRDFATSATTTIAAMNRVDFVRVHHVAAARETLAVANAVSWGWRPTQWRGGTAL